MKYIKIGLIVGSILGLLGLPSQEVFAASAASNTLSSGQVLLAGPSGQIIVTTYQGKVVRTLDNGLGAQVQSGMCFDAHQNLYITGFSLANITSFDNVGKARAFKATQSLNSPESCLFDKKGNLFVGDAGATNGDHPLNSVPGVIHEFNPSGTLIKDFSVESDLRGSDWIDLSADGCTMLYSSEYIDIKAFNVCTNTQLPDFAKLPLSVDISGNFSGASLCYGLRIRFNGEVMITCGNAGVYLLGKNGAVIKNFPLSTFPGTTLVTDNVSESYLFSLNLDPDGHSFWTANLGSADVYHVDINSGKLLSHFKVSQLSGVNGVAVVGELPVALPSPITHINGGNINATVNQPYSGPVATFQSENGFDATKLQATINWGDGTTSVGQVGSAGVVGTHTYTSSGSYNVQTFLQGYGASLNVKAHAQVSSPSPWSYWPYFTFPLLLLLLLLVFLRRKRDKEDERKDNVNYPQDDTL